MADLSDEELLDALGVDVKAESKSSKTPREERIIAGFEDIERFFEQHNRLPAHGEDKDIFERLYAIRLDKIRASEECRSILSGLDEHGLLGSAPVKKKDGSDDLDDEALLSALGVQVAEENDITNLKHVRPRAEVNAAEEVARRTACVDFHIYKPLFLKVQEELKLGIRKSREYKDDAQVKVGEFFILGGQKVYIAEMGEEFVPEHGRPDRRLRVIYDNGTESDLLMRSLQRALNKDETGRRITDPTAGPLFSDEVEDSDVGTGTIYVLRSKSDHPHIQEHREVIHKIGVTSGDIKKRFGNAKSDPTFLMADVEIVATYELSNINQMKLEGLIHKFFEPAKLNIEIKDRFGKPITPREWFLVPLFVIDEAIELIKDGSIVNYIYDVQSGKILEQANKKLKS